MFGGVLVISQFLPRLAVFFEFLRRRGQLRAVFPEVKLHVFDELVDLLRPILVQQNVLRHVRIETEITAFRKKVLFGINICQQ